MADNHIGMSIGLNVDSSGLLKANQSVTALQKKLSEVDIKFNHMHIGQGLSAEFDKANAVTASYIRRLGSEGKAYEANVQKVKLYKDAMADLTSKQKGLENALKATGATASGRASDDFKKLQVQVNDTATQINQVKSKLKTTTTEMQAIKPTFFNGVVQNSRAVVSSADKIKAHMSNAWNTIRGGATVATMALGAIGTYAMSGAKKLGSLQQTYREVNNLAVLGGEKQKEVTTAVAKMQKQGQEISMKYGQSQQTIAEGFEDLIKRGYTTKQALGSLKTEMQASIASGDDFKDVTTVSSQAIEAFGLKSSQTSKMLKNTKLAVNELAYSADATSTSFHSMGDAVHYFGSAAKAQHISLAESVSAVGVLSNNGVEGSMAGTSMRDIINRIGGNVAKIGTKNSIFDKLGITRKEMTDGQGRLKSLSNSMKVIWDHIKEHAHTSVDQQNFMKSIFGTTAQNSATILAENTRALDDLTKRTEEAGKKGTYVQQLASKNMGTAKGEFAQLKQESMAFSMTLGAKLLPAVNKAGERLSKFLLSKDGKAFQQNVANAVGKFANALVNFVIWASKHTTAMKMIGESLLIGYSIAKGAKFVAFLGDVASGINKLRGGAKVLQGIGEASGSLSGGSVSGTFGETTGSVAETAGSGIGLGAKFGTKFAKIPVLGKLASAGGKGAIGGGFARLSGFLGTGIEAGTETFKGFQHIHNANERSKDFGGAIGATAGGIATSFIPYVGPLLAPFGAMIGKYAGRWGGQAVNSFTKGWQRKKPPKKFWSIENLGYSNKTFWSGLVKGGQDFFKNFPNFVKHNKAGIFESVVSPFTGIPKLLYKNNKGFRTWVNGVGKTIKGGLKGADKWFIGIGNGIHKQWDKGMKASHKFFKNLPRNIHKFSKDFGTKWNRAWKGFNNSRYVKAFKKGKFVQTAFHDMKSRFDGFKKEFGKKWSAGWKSFNNSSAVKSFKKGHFFSDMISGINQKFNSWSKSFIKGWNNFWGGIGKGWNNFWGGMGTWAKKSWTGAKNNLKGFANSIVYGFGGSKHTFKYDKMPKHATGGHISATHGALVGELGPELAYKATGARLLGANGPEIAKVYAGEHILNARDTHKLFTGGLGKGLMLKGYASGTTRLKATKKNANNLKQLTKTSKAQWSEIAKSTKRQSVNAKKSAISNFTTMRKGVHKQMDSIRSGTISLARNTSKGFDKAMSKLKGYTRDTMSGTVSEMNRGIRGIDRVLSQFGGNTQVIKPARFAKGTNGYLSQDTLAMVNDAEVGPRQEAIIRRNGSIELPRYQNQITMIRKGEAVLNGAQTRELAHMYGLEHFAKGSGVSHSTLIKIARNAGKNPAGQFKSAYLSNIGNGKTNFGTGARNLLKNSSSSFGIPWNSAMWAVINDAIGDGMGKGGTREAFLKYAEKTFSGVKYVMGASSKVASDCSGMVMQALRHFGLDIGRTTVAMQNSSGVQYLGKDLSKTIPGDLVIFGHGTGALGHVGIIKNPKIGTMFNETPPRARVTNIADDKGMGYGYYRVRGLHNASSSSKKTGDSRLMALARSELGKSAISWIKKNLSDDLSAGSFKLGGDIGDRARILAKALMRADPRATKAGISAILGNWEFESTLNPTAVNSSGGASGLGQWLGSRLSALKAYAHRHGKSWTNPGVQLDFALHGDGANSSIFKRILEGSGSVSALASAFSSEWERGGYTAQHVAGAQKIRRALGYFKGGHPVVGNWSLVGENGPELVKFNKPAKVYSNDESKHISLSDMLGLKKKTTSKPVKTTSQAPVINININGPISSKKDAEEYAQIIIDRAITKLSNYVGSEFGADPSIY